MMGWRNRISDLFFERINPSHSPADRDTDTQSPWTAGFLIKNRYEIRGIKKPGQFVIYIAEDQAVKKTVSITTLRDDLAENLGAVREFLDGADEWVGVGHHTNILSADFAETLEGKPLLFTEYAGNEDLGQYLKSLSLEKTLDFGIQFCTGMEYAHGKMDNFHGYIRPSSVLVQKNPVFRYGYCYKIRDFGIARLFSLYPREVTGKHSADPGELSFKPPELFPQKIRESFSFEALASIRSDIYSFGSILYVLATGKMPFSSVNEVFSGYPVSPIIVNAGVPESLNRLIVKCMKRRPEERYQDFRGIKNDLIQAYKELTGEEHEVIGRKEEWARNDMNRITEVPLEPEPEFFDEMVAAFECSILLEPDNVEALTNKGDFLVELGRLDDAVAEYTRALELSPGDTRIWNTKGLLLARCGRLNEAVAAYVSFTELCPEDARAWNNLGVLLAELFRFEEAVTAYSRALDLAPGDSKIWNNKGDALAELGRFDEAVAAFRHVSAVNPDDTDAWYTTGSYPSLPGRFEIAPSSEDSAQEPPVEYSYRPREAEKWYCEGVSLARRGRFEEAVSAYDLATTLEPDYADAWLNKGTAYGILGKDQDAVRCFGKFVDLAPPESASQVRDLEQLICEMKP